MGLKYIRIDKDFKDPLKGTEDRSLENSLGEILKSSNSLAVGGTLYLI